MNRPRIRHSPERRPAFRPVLESLESRLVPAVSFHGGAVIPHVEVMTVFYGQAWVNNPQTTQLDTFVQDLTHSPYMDFLSQYGVGRGAWIGQDVIPANLAPGTTVTDAQLQTALVNEVNQGRLLPPNGNRVYVVYTAPDVVVSAGSLGNSLTDFVGYHNDFHDPAGRDVVYAVVPNPQGNGDVRGLNDFQTQTSVTSHELAEMATNPNGGGWWQNSTGDEIGDLAQGSNGPLDGYAVQYLWSNLSRSIALPPSSPAPVNSNAVANFITHSAEYLGSLVVQDYEQFLGRPPAPGEVAAWAQAMQQGLTDQQLAGFLIGSQEFYQNAGGTDRAWVDALYQDLLGRPADAAGESAWLNALSEGASRTAIAQSFAATPEREALVIQADFQAYLGRAANASEVANWVNVFEQFGVTNEQIVAGILSSPEFLAQHAGTANSWLGAVYNILLGRAPDWAGYQQWLAVIG